ncbi:MAG: ABC transporter permease [Candidatus Thermoplasmatota archaeon]|nr:ABC transporter permease [Candidatus Thermoplasmatota archaeon]MCL5254247.1 ABC transporter permease [Candidatus Thermoplasmatota archaeon]
MTAEENIVKMEMQGDGIPGIPGGITQAIKIAKYEMLNYIRSRRFYVLLLIDLIIGGLLTVIVGYYRPSSVLASTLSFYSTWWGSIIGFLVVLSCIFFGGDAISGEFQNRTGYFLIGNPIRRSSVYTGKFIGALLSALVVVFLYFFIALANGIYYFGASVPSQLIESLLFSLVYLLSVMGFTFFFSSLFRSSVTSVILTAILFLFVFSTVQTFLSLFVGIEPWFLISYGAGIISAVFTVPYPAHISKSVSRFGLHLASVTTYTPTIVEGLLIMVAYFIISVMLGLLLFERSEFR